MMARINIKDLEIQHTSTYLKLTKRDMDIKLQIQQLIQASSLTFEFTQVSGHQDDVNDFVYENAPQSVQRNIDMDKKATRFLQHPPPNLRPTESPLQLPSQKATLQIGNSMIVGDIQHQIHLHHHGPKIEQRMINKMNIPYNVMTTID